MEKDFLFTPREFRTNEITVEDKDKLKNLYNNTASRLDNKLGRKANFGDFIKSQIEQFGYDKVDEMFEGLKYAWSNIGRDTSDFKIVYYKYYHKPISADNENFISNEIPNKDKENDKSLVLLYGIGFLWVLGASGILGIIRYLLNPEIPTWILYAILFVVFIIVWKTYFENKK